MAADRFELVRLLFLYYQPLHSNPTDSTIRTWAWVPVWSQIEVDIGILTACLPCLSPLLRLFWSEVSVHRSMTQSMVELPKYDGGLTSDGALDSQEGRDMKEKAGTQQGKVPGEKEVRWSEKELPPVPVERASYYEGASDEEEARESGVAREVSNARSSSKRTLRSRRIA